MNSIASYGTHIFGGELLYTHISGNTYKVTLTLYGDCGATNDIFQSLYIAKPNVNVYINDVLYQKRTFKVESAGVEVSPVCPEQIMNTTCNGGILPGVKKFVYADTITLSGPAKWRFIFTGNMNTTQAGRSSNITNISGGGSSVMQLEAALDNTNGNNSSPQYSTIPTPFYCVNVEEQYNHGAIDADGDSLAFSLVPGINAALDPLLSGGVSYISPASETSPIITDPGAFVFNILNGQITFTTPLSQDALVVCQVDEYRNGALVGTSKREMTFIVLSDCEGTPPGTKITDLVGGTISGKNVVNICIGTPSLSFNIPVINPDNDITVVTPKNVPAGALLTVSNNNTTHPSMSFSWKTDTLPPGVYTFYVTIHNNHCPISNTQTVAYTINVAPIPTLSVHQLSATGCVRQANMQYNLAYGFLPRTLTIRQGGKMVKTYTDTTGIITDSLPPGTYTAIASSDPLCTTGITFSIADSGTLPVTAPNQSLCVGQPSAPLYIEPAGNNATIVWFDGQGNILEQAPTPNTSVAGTYNWTVVQTYRACTSERIPVTVTVHPLPVPQILNVPQSVCFGDTMLLEATGGTSYSWSPTDILFAGKNGELYTRITIPVTVTVVATDEYNCVDSTTATYGNIEACCNFAFPNSFTPNGDGKNDGYRVITYGNMMHFRLQIYNRWGQIVYSSLDPLASWDGKQYGTPCPIGTYFYYMQAECLTGHKETHKGDITLVR